MATAPAPHVPPAKEAIDAPRAAGQGRYFELVAGTAYALFLYDNRC